MRVVVIGTSNSVKVTGYTAAVKLDPRIATFTNISIGASTSVHSIRSAAAIDFSQYDYCLMDFSVNEEIAIKAKAIEISLITDIVESLIIRCIAEKCLPVVLVFPRFLETSKARMREFYIDLAAKWKLPYFDFYPVIDVIAERTDIARLALFRDSAHVHDWMALLFGRIISDGLAHLDNVTEKFLPSAPLRGRRFASIPLADRCVDGDLAVVQRVSSQSSGDFIKIEAPRMTEFCDIPGESVLGFSANLRETACFIKLIGRTEAAIDLRNPYFDNPSFRLIVSSVLLKEPLVVDGGRIRLETLDDAGSVALENVSSGSTEQSRASDFRATGNLEVSDLLVVLVDEVVSHLRVADVAHVDFAMLDTLPTIDLVCALYRSLRSKATDDVAEADFREEMRVKRLRRAGKVSLDTAVE